jgi:chemotaxis protein CheD
MNDAGMFDIGKRNCLALRKVLSNHGLVAHAQETGGTVARTLRIEVATGRVSLHVSGEEIMQMNPRPIGFQPVPPGGER